jgi:hypothetical protein
MAYVLILQLHYFKLLGLVNQMLYFGNPDRRKEFISRPYPKYLLGEINSCDRYK